LHVFLHIWFMCLGHLHGRFRNQVIKLFACVCGSFCDLFAIHSLVQHRGYGLRPCLKPPVIDLLCFVCFVLSCQLYVLPHGVIKYDDDDHNDQVSGD